MIHRAKWPVFIGVLFSFSSAVFAGLVDSSESITADGGYVTEFDSYSDTYIREESIQADAIYRLETSVEAQEAGLTPASIVQSVTRKERDAAVISTELLLGNSVRRETGSNDHNTIRISSETDLATDNTQRSMDVQTGALNIRASDSIEFNSGEIAFTRGTVALGDIENLESTVSANSTGVVTNTTAIATNTTAIAANTTAVASNTTAVRAVESAMTTYSSGYTTNAADIVLTNQRINSIQDELMAEDARINGRLGVLEDDLYNGIASAIAISNVAYSTGGTYVSMGYGRHKSKQSVAGGVSYANDKSAFKLSFAKGGTVGVGVSLKLN